MLPEQEYGWLFRKSEEGERRVWVDRGIDGRLDDFQLCGPCSDALQKDDPVSGRWHNEEELCLECRVEFAAHSMAVDLLGLPRPSNGMLDRVLTNYELDSDPRPPVQEAFAYFLPSPGDDFAANAAEDVAPAPQDGFAPGPADAFGPGVYDGFLSGPGASFLPGSYDAFSPGPGDFFQPGPYDAFMPGSDDALPSDREDAFAPSPGDYFLPGMEDYLLLE